MSSHNDLQQTRFATTKVIKVEGDSSLDSSLEEAIKWLREGEVVAFPTETVYGLGANALNPKAVSRIFEAKGRPSDNPLIVHVSSMDMLKGLVEETDLPTEGSTAWQLITKFWPGPLTLLFRKSRLVPEAVTAGQPKVAVRMPSHPVARRLIELAGVPIAAPSANLSGRPSPTIASHVYFDLAGRIPCIVDGGATTFGLESTVVDLNSILDGRPLVLRPGGVTLEQLRVIVPTIEVYEEATHGSNLKEKPPTPGLKYTHYSPNATVILVEHRDETNVMREKVSQLIEKAQEKGERIGVIHTHLNTLRYPPELISDALVIQYQNNNSDLNKDTTTTMESPATSPLVILYELGNEDEIEVVAKGIFQSLRELEELKVSTIVIEGVPDTHVGRAVMNRLRKAASLVL